MIDRTNIKSPSPSRGTARRRRESYPSLLEAVEPVLVTRLLSLSEVSVIFGVPERRVREVFVRKRGLPCIRFGKNCLRFRPADVREWLARIGAGFIG